MPHATFLRRIRAEYLEMPGLRLTQEQVQRLCGVDRAVCKAVLDSLVEAKFLCVRADGTYALLSDVDQWRPRPISASLNPTKRAVAS
jgi:hypothetical protein